MRRVWFVFKLIETILGLSCLGYHARGFLNINFIQDHYVYVAVFCGFSLMSMFGCLSICLKEPVSVVREGVLSMLAAISFIVVSLNSMYHAEKDFHLMYFAAETSDDTQQEHKVDIEQEPRPFFKYSKAQSVAALTAGCLFMLHSILAFDFALSEGEEISMLDDEELDEDEQGGRMQFYVLGRTVHNWLDQFEWFHSLADEPKKDDGSHLQLHQI